MTLERSTKGGNCIAVRVRKARKKKLRKNLLLAKLVNQKKVQMVLQVMQQLKEEPLPGEVLLPLLWAVQEVLKDLVKRMMIRMVENRVM